VDAAQEIVAEAGPRAIVFSTASHFASWIGICPEKQESAGVSFSSRSAKGNMYLRRLLCQIAWAAIRSKGTFFGGSFARLSPRLGAKAAA
jgi:transposase